MFMYIHKDLAHFHASFTVRTQLCSGTARTVCRKHVLKITPLLPVHTYFNFFSTDYAVKDVFPKPSVLPTAI